MALRANENSFKADEYPQTKSTDMQLKMCPENPVEPIEMTYSRISKPNLDFSERSTASHLITNFSRNYSLQKQKPLMNNFTEGSGGERDTAATTNNKSSLFQTRINSLPANDLTMRSTFNNFTYKGEPYVLQQRKNADLIASSLLS